MFERGLRHLEELEATTQAIIAASDSEPYQVVCDPEGLVTVTVATSGRIVNLDFSERALTYPQTLDRKISDTIMRARRLARENYRHFLAENHPEYASWRSRIEPLAFLTREERRQVGELNGRHLYDIESTEDILRRESITEKVDRGGGTVSLSVNGDELHVKLTREAIRDVGPNRLGKRITAAINRAEKQANELKQQMLKSLATW